MRLPTLIILVSVILLAMTAIPARAQPTSSSPPVLIGYSPYELYDLTALSGELTFVAGDGIYVSPLAQGNVTVMLVDSAGRSLVNVLLKSGYVKRIYTFLPSDPVGTWKILVAVRHSMSVAPSVYFYHIYFAGGVEGVGVRMLDIKLTPVAGSPYATFSGLVRGLGGIEGGYVTVASLGSQFTVKVYTNIHLSLSVRANVLYIETKGRNVINLLKVRLYSDVVLHLFMTGYGAEELTILKKSIPVEVRKNKFSEAIKLPPCRPGVLYLRLSHPMFRADFMLVCGRDMDYWALLFPGSVATVPEGVEEYAFTLVAPLSPSGDYRLFLLLKRSGRIVVSEERLMVETATIRVVNDADGRELRGYELGGVDAYYVDGKAIVPLNATKTVSLKWISIDGETLPPDVIRPSRFRLSPGDSLTLHVTLFNVTVRFIDLERPLEAGEVLVYRSSAGENITISKIEIAEGAVSLYLPPGRYVMLIKSPKLVATVTFNVEANAEYTVKLRSANPLITVLIILVGMFVIYVELRYLKLI